MRCLEARLVGTGTDAVRHLIKAVAQRLRADLDRLKQDVVFWVARHILVLLMWSGDYPGRARRLRQRSRIIFSIERRLPGGRRAHRERVRAEGKARASERNSMSVTVVQIYCVQCKLANRRTAAARNSIHPRGPAWR